MALALLANALFMLWATILDTLVYMKESSARRSGIIATNWVVTLLLFFVFIKLY